MDGVRHRQLGGRLRGARPNLQGFQEIKRGEKEKRGGETEEMEGDQNKEKKKRQKERKIEVWRVLWRHYDKCKMGSKKRQCTR